MPNPLLDMTGLPPFARILPEHVEPALDAILADCRAGIAALTTADRLPTWDDFVEPLEELDDRLSRDPVVEDRI